MQDPTASGPDGVIRDLLSIVFSLTSADVGASHGDPRSPLRQAIIERINGLLRRLTQVPQSSNLASGEIEGAEATVAAIKALVNDGRTLNESRFSQTMLLIDGLASEVSDIIDRQNNRGEPHAFYGISERYRLASRDDARMAMFWTLAATFLSLVALVILFIGVLHINTGKSSRWWAYALSAGVVLIATVPAWITSERLRRSARDNTRLSLQLQQLGPYLGDFPADKQVAIQVMLAPRLFARIIDDNDPIREPLWPAASDFLSKQPKSG